MDRMPEAGDLIVAFSPQPGRCLRMVQSRQLQATHCRGEPAWMGRWRDALGRTRNVEACRGHVRYRFGGVVSAFGVDRRAPIPYRIRHEWDRGTYGFGQANPCLATLGFVPKLG